MKEQNTFDVSTYIAAPEEAVYEYLCELKNLGEWTLYSRMQKQMDEATWWGTASGYPEGLYYHVKPLEIPHFKAIEWSCGVEYQKYYQVYPALLFSPSFIEPGSTEEGTYFHWISFADPKKRPARFMDLLPIVHTSECRSLKAAMERKAGHGDAVRGKYRLDGDTMYIDVPIEDALEYLADLRNMDDWAHLLQADGEVQPLHGSFRDEYNKRVEARISIEQAAGFYTVEYDLFYPDFNYHERSVTLLMPTAYVFADPDSVGFIHHRITFWPVHGLPPHGKQCMEDYSSESLNIKRLLEVRFGKSRFLHTEFSYVPGVQDLVAE